MTNRTSAEPPVWHSGKAEGSLREEACGCEALRGFLKGILRILLPDHAENAVGESACAQGDPDQRKARQHQAAPGGRVLCDGVARDFTGFHRRSAHKTRRKGRCYRPGSGKSDAFIECL